MSITIYLFTSLNQYNKQILLILSEISPILHSFTFAVRGLFFSIACAKTEENGCTLSIRGASYSEYITKR